MKKSFVHIKIVSTIIICLILIATNIFNLSSSALALESGDYTYTPDGHITSYKGSNNDINIPLKIDGIDVVIIADSAFKDCGSLTRVIIPNSVQQIHQFAFSGCKNLASISIPNDITQIGQEAFFGCSNLKEITIPENVKGIAHATFSGCSSLNVISLSRLEYIGDESFKDCSSLTEIILPYTVTTIEANAFSGCTNLKAITIPSYVTQITKDVFSQCSNLVIYGENDSYAQKYAVMNNIPFKVTDSVPKRPALLNPIMSKSGEYEYSIIDDANVCITSYRGANTDISIPSTLDGKTVKTINYGASLQDCTSITIPNTVVEIGDFALTGSKLTKINVDANNPNFASADGVLYNKNKTELIQYPIARTETTYKIPSSVTSLGRTAFYQCKSIKNITLPDNLTTIGYHSFIECSNLAKITIWNKVRSIGKDSFARCGNLKIYGEKDSYAEQYSTEMSIPFTPIPFTPTSDNNDFITFICIAISIVFIVIIGLLIVWKVKKRKDKNLQK